MYSRSRARARTATPAATDSQQSRVRATSQGHGMVASPKVARLPSLGPLVTKCAHGRAHAGSSQARNLILNS
jgi:hypothetical protein